MPLIHENDPDVINDDVLRACIEVWKYCFLFPIYVSVRFVLDLATMSCHVMCTGLSVSERKSRFRTLVSSACGNSFLLCSSSLAPTRSRRSARSLVSRLLAISLSLRERSRCLAGASALALPRSLTDEGLLLSCSLQRGQEPQRQLPQPQALHRQRPSPRRLLRARRARPLRPVFSEADAATPHGRPPSFAGE